MFHDQLIAGRRILVTGGGTGLGKSMAARFLQLGAEVHICGRRKIVCDETATELMDLHGGRVVSHGVDIRNAMAVDEMIERLVQRLKKQPGDVETWRMLGWSHVSIGHYPEGAEAYRKATELQPEGPRWAA